MAAQIKDGCVVVSDTVAEILNALAADIEDSILGGKADVSVIADTAAQIALLASGQWGAGQLEDK